MKAYLISWLARQERLTADMAAFERSHPGPWLVWEAGPWRPPSPDRATRAASERRARESSGDALALLVAPRPGRELFEGVRLGRGPDNDLVVDDGTLSRTHLLLRKRAEGWTVEDLHSSNGTQVDGTRVNGAPVVLEPGAQIEAGSVRLTFYDAKGLFLRLKHGVT
ncbi:MAG TPA: FHA domain-containing protein [Anaeromyxobacter sp.]|nr:FHA domain-containing protein [Anaeromyxobacter sp.]